LDANKFRFSARRLRRDYCWDGRAEAKNGARWLGRVGVSTATSPGGWKDARTDGWVMGDRDVFGWDG